MKSRILAVLLCAAMLISFNACDGKTGSSLSSGAGSTASDAAWNPGSTQRAVLKQAGVMCGVMYIGFVEKEMTDPDAMRSDYDRLIRASGGFEEFEFLRELPDSQLVSTAMGHDLYLIIPTDPDAKVEVSEVSLDYDNDCAYRVERTLYSAENGAPFLLQCNYSDIFSDAQIMITNPDGTRLKWMPFMSLKDGTVQTEADDGQKVYDFTEYQFSEEE